MNSGTLIFIITTVVVLCIFALFDIYAWLYKKEFISYSIYKICSNKPIIPFILGILTGHFLWLNTPPELNNTIIQEKITHKVEDNNGKNRSSENISIEQ